MEIRLRLGERTLAVTLSDDAEGLRAVVDGDTHDVRRIATSTGCAADGREAMELLVRVDGRVWHAFVVRAGDRLLVSLDGRVHAFALGDAPRRGAATGGVGVAVTPMPGKVIRVLVAVGDRVEPGQALVVLEAMKMETTLRAEVGGTVSAVHAANGDMVDGGSTLVEITAG